MGWEKRERESHNLMYIVEKVDLCQMKKRLQRIRIEAEIPVRKLSNDSGEEKPWPKQG